MTLGTMRTVAALFVDAKGPYIDLPGVDPWPEERDARLYAGPHPVVVHSPCARWGKYWFGGPTAHLRNARRELGDDGGCAASGLAAVRRWGGVFEHPEGSHVWRWFGMCAPPRAGGWVNADWLGGWTCCVEQGHYGHRGRKATWLYAVGVDPLPSLKWGPSEASIKMDDGYHAAEERRRLVRTGAVQRMSHRERRITPEPFRDLLLSMARSVSL